MSEELFAHPVRSLWPWVRAVVLRRGLATVREIVQIAVRDESGKVRSGSEAEIQTDPLPPFALSCDLKPTLSWPDGAGACGALCAPQACASVHRIDEPEPSERKRQEEAQRDDFHEVPLGGKIKRNARLAGGRGRRRRSGLEADIPVPHPFVGLFVVFRVTDARLVGGG